MSESCEGQFANGPSRDPAMEKRQCGNQCPSHEKPSKVWRIYLIQLLEQNMSSDLSVCIYTHQKIIAAYSQNGNMSSMLTSKRQSWVVVPLSNTSCPALLTSKSQVPSPCPCVQLRKSHRIGMVANEWVETMKFSSMGTPCMDASNSKTVGSAQTPNRK